MNIRKYITGWLILTVAFAGLGVRFFISADFITGALFFLAAAGTTLNMISNNKKEKLRSFKEYIHMN